VPPLATGSKLGHAEDLGGGGTSLDAYSQHSDEGDGLDPSILGDTPGVRDHNTGGSFGATGRHGQVLRWRVHPPSALGSSGDGLGSEDLDRS
jgi:hypothetical protein